MHEPRSSPRRDTLRRAAVAVAWLVTAAVAGLLAVVRYRGVVGDPSAGHDLWIFVDAAASVSAGGSPYDVAGYVYPPLLAVVLAPVAGVDLLAAWTVAALAAFLAGIVAVLLSVWERVATWERPAVALLAVVTLLWSHPTSFSLWLGQTDAFVFLALALATLAAVRGRPGAAGLALAVAAAVKTWPALVGVSVFRRGAVGRWRTVAVATGSFVVLVLLAALPLGIDGVADWWRRTASMSDQPLAAYSVWGVGRDLFSATGVMAPMLEVPVLGTAVTVVLLVVVVALLAVALRFPGDPVLVHWHVVACVLLLLPVSHVWYLPMTLPMLWVWAVRRREAGTVRWAVVTGVLLVCWWVVFRTWAGDPREPETTGYAMVVVAEIVALAVSVLASRTSRAREGVAA